MKNPHHQKTIFFPCTFPELKTRLASQKASHANSQRKSSHLVYINLNNCGSLNRESDGRHTKVHFFPQDTFSSSRTLGEFIRKKQKKSKNTSQSDCDVLKLRAPCLQMALLHSSTKTALCHIPAHRRHFLLTCPRCT